MSEEKFPLPGSSYKELSKVIAAYAEIPVPTAPGPVGQIAVVHETVVSRNNKFLVAVGLIEGGQKKTCTSLGTKLGRAIQHEQDEAIRGAWAEVVANTDFLQKTISAVRIRKGMEESALASHIAFTSGSPKNAYARAGAGSVIEILQLSGSIAAEGSTLIAGATGRSSETEGNGGETLIPLHTRQTLERTPAVLARTPSSPETSGIQLRINVNISCSVSDLSELGSQLRRIREEFTQQSNDLGLLELTHTTGSESDEAEPPSSSEE